MTYEEELIRAYNQRDDVAFDSALTAVRNELDHWRQGDPMGDLINANRDQILKIHEEAVKRVRRAIEPLKYLGSVKEGLDILDALSTFHPMYSENWVGWPEGSG